MILIAKLNFSYKTHDFEYQKHKNHAKYYVKNMPFLPQKGIQSFEINLCVQSERISSDNKFFKEFSEKNDIIMESISFEVEKLDKFFSGLGERYFNRIKEIDMYLSETWTDAKYRFIDAKKEYLKNVFKH